MKPAKIARTIFSYQCSIFGEEYNIIISHAMQNANLKLAVLAQVLKAPQIFKVNEHFGRYQARLVNFIPVAMQKTLLQ